MYNNNYIIKRQKNQGNPIEINGLNKKEKSVLLSKNYMI